MSQQIIYAGNDVYCAVGLSKIVRAVVYRRTRNTWSPQDRKRAITLNRKAFVRNVGSASAPIAETRIGKAGTSGLMFINVYGRQENASPMPSTNCAQPATEYYWRCTRVRVRVKRAIYTDLRYTNWKHKTFGIHDKMFWRAWYSQSKSRTGYAVECLLWIRFESQRSSGGRTRGRGV